MKMCCMCICRETHMGFPGGSDSKESACSAETQVQSLGWEDVPEKRMATHSSILVWRIPWTEKPSRLQFMGLQSQTQLSHNTSSIMKMCRMVLLYLPAFFLIFKQSSSITDSLKQCFLFQSIFFCSTVPALVQNHIESPPNQCHFPFCFLLALSSSPPLLVDGQRAAKSVLQGIDVMWGGKK